MEKIDLEQLPKPIACFVVIIMIVGAIWFLNEFNKSLNDGRENYSSAVIGNATEGLENLKEGVEIAQDIEKLKKIPKK